MTRPPGGGEGGTSRHGERAVCCSGFGSASPSAAQSEYVGLTLIQVGTGIGGRSIKTTQRYYLSVQEDDMEQARVVQSQVLGLSGLTPK